MSHSLSLSRRSFLQGLAASAAMLAMQTPYSTTFAGSPPLHKRQLLMGVTPGHMGAYDLDSHVLRTAKTGFAVHSVIQNPKNRRQIVAIDKWARGLAVLDLDTMQVEQRLPAANHYMYYGHGFFAADGSVFFITRVDLRTGHGHFVGFNSKTYKLVEDYQVTVGGLHECHLIDANTAIVASSGLRSKYGPPQAGKRVEPSGLVWVNVNNGKILHRLLVEDDDQIVGHFGRSSQGAILALSGPRIGAKAKAGKIYYSKDGREALRPITFSEEQEKTLSGEMLSVAFRSKGAVAAITNPLGRQVIVLNVPDTKVDWILNREESREEHGIVYDKVLRKFVLAGAEIAVLNEAERRLIALPMITKSDPIKIDLGSTAHSLIV